MGPGPRGFLGIYFLCHTRISKSVADFSGIMKWVKIPLFRHGCSLWLPNGCEAGTQLSWQTLSGNQQFDKYTIGFIKPPFLFFFKYDRICGLIIEELFSVVAGNIIAGLCFGKTTQKKMLRINQSVFTYAFIVISIFSSGRYLLMKECYHMHG